MATLRHLLAALGLTAAAVACTPAGETPNPDGSIDVPVFDADVDASPPADLLPEADGPADTVEGDASDMATPDAAVPDAAVPDAAVPDAASSDVTPDLMPPGGACSALGCGASSMLPAGVNLNGVWIGPAGEVWAVGEGGFLGRRTPETGAWCWCAPLPPATLRGVWGASSGNVFAVGDEGTLLRYDGTSWLLSLDATLDLHAVFGTAADNVWAVGEKGTAMRFDGTAWRSELADARYDLRGVWIDPAGVVRVAGSGALPEGEPGVSPTSEAVVLRRGVGWTVETSFPVRGNAAFLAMSGSAASDVWAVGVNTPSGAAAGYGFVVHFDGATWAVPQHPDDLFESRYFTGVAAATPDGGSAWFLGGTAGIRLAGASWTVSSVLASTTAMNARGAQMFAVGFDGGIMRWTAATDWTVERAPTPAGDPGP